MATEREQKLIDLCFSIGFLISSPFEGRDGKKEDLRDLSQEKEAEWIAEQLRGCGFDTEPIGSSWGVLKD